jgi:Leucine-rich repeat (LRR) protein
VERTLRVFETAFAMDLSQNEIEQFPMTIPTGIFALDLSFNMISLLVGVERLGMLQEINLSYNRIHDVRMLEACPRLLRVNLSGNRLSTTQGLETLEFLEVLDLSENLIDS